IGAVYQNMINYGQALIYFNKAEQLAIETHDELGLASIYIPLSDIGLYQGKPKEASIGYAEKAIEIYRRNGDQFAENIALQTLAKVYYYHDDYIKAEPIARRALEQATELGFPKPIAE